ncbi:MAG: hypothetical protein ABMB14_40465, partial [Myxococcota bacterium]
MVVLLLLWTAPARAGTWYSVTFCVTIPTNYTDLGGDVWAANANRPARGVKILIDEFYGGVYQQNVMNGYTDNAGCVTRSLWSNSDYRVYALTDAEVNGVPIMVHQSPTLPSPYYYPMYPGTVGGGFRPTASTTITLVMPVATATAQLAVAMTAMNQHNAGLGSSTPLKYDNSNYSPPVYNGGGQEYIKAATFSKSIIAHETGHGVYRRRDNNTSTVVDNGSATDNCDGEGTGSGGHSTTTKEWYSTALKEGWADFYAAWLWNTNASD